MVKHIILWKIKEGKSEEEKLEIKQTAKKELEALYGQIDGLTSMKIQSEALATSNADLMLDSSFDDAEALSYYATHPAHVHVADTYIRPFMEQRLCLDFEQ